MSRCAYCDRDAPPAPAEDLIPAWFHRHEPLWDEPLRAHGWTVRTDRQVDDVCVDCRARLAPFAAYGRQLFVQQLARYQYADAATSIAPDHALLVPWLLRLAYDAARVHGEPAPILAQYRDVMRGDAPVPAGMQLWLRTVAPAVRSADLDVVPASRRDAAADHPDWFRIGTFGLDDCGCVFWSLRQIAICSHVFLLLVPDRDRPGEAAQERIDRTEAIDEEMHGAVWLGPGSHVWLPAPWDSIHYTIWNAGCFPLGCERMEHAPVPTTIGDVPDVLVIPLPRAQIEAGDVAPVLAVLADLVSSAEIAAAYRERIEFVVAGYEADPRPLHAIPEVVAFVRSLDRSWKYWFFFQHPLHGWLRTLVHCLCAAPDDHGVATIDPGAYGESLSAWFRALNYLAYRFRIGDAARDRLSAQAYAILARGEGRADA